MDKNILIIGGYGTVGRIISKQLALIFPNKIIVAGRNFDKAKQLAEETNHQITPKQFDVLTNTDDTIFENVQLVIMCIDQNSTNFISRCIDKGIDYIDITAENSFFNKVALLHNAAVLKKTTVLLSVGLAPGITNLLAKNALKNLSGSKKLDLFVLLGLGEKHGDAAYKWTFNNIHTKYSITKNNKQHKIKSFSYPKTTNLQGKRVFYSFNFSDQHILGKTTNVSDVITRFAFDSKFLTRLIGVLRIIGISKIFKNRIIQNALLFVFKKIRIGSDIYAVKAIASRKNGEFYESSLIGNCESKITAFMTVCATLELLKQATNPKGVYHIHEMITDINSFFKELQKYDPSIKIKL